MQQERPFSAVSIEKLPSGKHRAVVRHAGARRASEAVPAVAEARMLEAKLKLAIGGSATPRQRHEGGDVVAGYIADGASRLSPGTLDFYRKGLAALPDAFRNRAVNEVPPLVLDGVYGELRDEGASEHKDPESSPPALRGVQPSGAVRLDGRQPVPPGHQAKGRRRGDRATLA